MSAPSSPGKRPAATTPSGARLFSSPVKFVVHGEEMVEKKVHQTGNSGRVYLPQAWIGRRVKVILVKR
jgi:putative transposon-encoded protein